MALAGMTFCVTGKFSQPRAAFEALLRSHGADVAGTVTKKVTHLLCEGDEGSSKYVKAEELGLPINDEAWVMGLIGGKGKKAAAPAKAPAKAPKRKHEDSDDEEGGDDDDDAPATASKVFAGMTFCVTGKFSRTRNQIERLLILNGGEVSKTVTRKVTHLLCEGEEGTSKHAKAEELGIPIEDEAWMESMIKVSGPATKKAKPTPAAAPVSTRAPAAAPVSTKGKIVKVGGKAEIPVDDHCPLAGRATVVDDFDATLNQTNIAFNNNKFYRIQLLKEGASFVLWTRWGRVGASGQTQSKKFGDRATAEREFEKKFLAKTMNAWAARRHFVPKPRKYTMLDVDHGDDEDEEGGGDEDGGEDEDEGEAPAMSAPKRAAKRAPVADDDEDGEDEGGAEVVGTKLLFEAKLKSGQVVNIVQCDIADIEADAVVHPASSSIGFGGQVGQVLERAGGPALQKAAKDFNNKGKSIALTECVVTEAGELPASRVIHVNSPSYGGNKKKSCEDLADTITNALQAAHDNNLKSIAFPSIGSGVNGYPKDLAAKTILTAIGDYFMELDKQGETSNVEEVYFVLYDQASMDLYTASFQDITGGLGGAMATGTKKAVAAPAAAATAKGGRAAAATTTTATAKAAPRPPAPAPAAAPSLDDTVEAEAEEDEEAEAEAEEEEEEDHEPTPLPVKGAKPPPPKPAAAKAQSVQDNAAVAELRKLAVGMEGNSEGDAPPLVVELTKKNPPLTAATAEAALKELFDGPTQRGAGEEAIGDERYTVVPDGDTLGGWAGPEDKGENWTDDQLKKMHKILTDRSLDGNVIDWAYSAGEDATFNYGYAVVTKEGNVLALRSDGAVWT